MPNQLFINGEFVEAQAGKTFNTVNPTDESVCLPSSLELILSHEWLVTLTKNYNVLYQI